MQRDVVANIVDNSTYTDELRFFTLDANTPYYLQDLGKYLFNKSVITNIQLQPYSAVLIDGIFNQLAPLDFAKFYVWLLDDNQNTIMDGVPLVTFSELGTNFARRFLHLENVNMQYSYIVWNGTALITDFPLVLPLLFTYYNPNRKEYDINKLGYNI